MKAFGLAVGLDHRCEFLLGFCVAGSRRMARASTAMAVRKQRLDALRSAKTANPARQASGMIN
jgi:hypothetical protein